MKDGGKYRGVVVPMVTPVTEQGAIDVAAAERIVGLFAGHGVHPLLMGTTGEGNSVSPRQGLLLVEAAVAAARTAALRQGVPAPIVYVGLSGCCVSEHIRMANEYHQLGADVVVATLPGYYALTDGQIYEYYKTLADGISAPLMLYNIRATTHMSIPVGVVERLSKHPNIVGLKDSERDLERMNECLAIARSTPGFAYFCGWAAQSASSLLMGADGIVPSTGNFVPELFAELYGAARSGDAGKTGDLQERTDRIARIYQEGRTLGESLAALKVMMGTRSLCGPDMLAPLTRLGAEAEEACRRETVNVMQDIDV
ncbi:MAG: dihydrodipicolinate synthase family protein [Mediterranea sp.]|jgi:4-hydroxy-tetrahydrodipicolinate synthase|nr:dihydrodipicolinate synthase family protein [Mediterranea sp.]